MAVVKLRRHNDHQQAERLILDNLLTDTTKVFERADGTILQPDSLSNLCRKITKKLGCEGISLHSLRHSFSTFMLQENVHPRVVQEMLRYSSVAVTLDIYSHPGMDLQRAAAQRLNDAVTGDKKAAVENVAIANG